MALEARQIANVLIIGTTGVGKSTLANLLVFGEESREHGGYAVGDGGDSMTTECDCRSIEQQRCILQVTDTPGVPDTNPAKSLENYDRIIEYVRRAPRLNAIIIMVEARRTMEKQYEDMRVLMDQFNMLPCAKIMVCRVDFPGRCPDRRKREKDEAARRLMDNICKRARLSYAQRYILHNMDDEEVTILRDLVIAMPIASMAGLNLRTFEEVKTAFERLSNADTRMKALEDELNALRARRAANERLKQKLFDLEVELDNQEASDKRFGYGGIAVEAAAGALVSQVAEYSGLGMLAGTLCITLATLAYLALRVRSERQKAATKIDELSREIEQKEEELKRGRVNPDELERARIEYEKLCTLCSP